MREKGSGIGSEADAPGTGRRALQLGLDTCGFAFLATFSVYLVLLAMEGIRKGSVTFFFDPDKALYVCLASGALYILGGRYDVAGDGTARAASSLRRLLPALFAAALAALLTYRLMASYGWHAVLVSFSAGALAGVAGYCASIPRM